MPLLVWHFYTLSLELANTNVDGDRKSALSNPSRLFTQKPTNGRSGVRFVATFLRYPFWSLGIRFKHNCAHLQWGFYYGYLWLEFSGSGVLANAFHEVDQQVSVLSQVSSINKKPNSCSTNSPRTRTLIENIGVSCGTLLNQTSLREPCASL